MRLAITVKEDSWDSKVDPRFGRTEHFLIYDEENDNTDFIDNSDITGEAHGVGPLAAQKMFEVKPDAIITGNGPGNKAAAVLSRSNIEIYVGADGMTAKEAYRAFKDGKLNKF